MQSIAHLTEEQKESFRCLAKDFGGPCMTLWCLELLEDVAYQISSPDSDPSWVTQDTKTDFDVAMLALEYFRMRSAMEE